MMAVSDTISGVDIAELNRLAEVADQLEAERIGNDVRNLAERISEGRFYVACLGQSKRGKSTLLNALIGDAILPTGVVPVTSVPTVVRYGTTISARVLMEGWWQPIPVRAVVHYVSEEHNPENAKRVGGVEVFVPADLLRDGMCLVDTPGIGSVFSGNTAATQTFIPHVDAAVVVVGADPPLSGDELALVRDVAGHVTDLVFVLNKADRYAQEECKIAASFTIKTLQERLSLNVIEIYKVSAVEELTSRSGGYDWHSLVSKLRKLSTRSGRRLLRAAMQRGVQRIRTLLLSIVDEERDALLRPVEQLEARLSALQKIISDAQQSLVDLEYLLNGVQRRVSATMEQRRDAFLKSSRTIAAKEYAQNLAKTTIRFGPAYRRSVLDAADEIVRRQVTPWLEREQSFAEEIYGTATERYVCLANEFLKRVSEEGAIADRVRLLEYQAGLNTPSEFEFEDFISIRRPASPIRYVADTILGLLACFNPVQQAGYEFVDRLLETNSSRVQNDLEQRLMGSRRRLEQEVREALTEAVSISQRAVHRARKARQSGQRVLEARLQKLTSLRSALES